MSANVDLNDRPDYDRVLQTFADYVLDYQACLTSANNHRPTLPTLDQP